MSSRIWGLLAVGIGLASPAIAENCDRALAAPVETPEPLRTILVEQCGSCHRGPFLDFSKTPFFSDQFTSEKALMEESLRRARLTDRKRMPPLNFDALSPEAIALLENYLATLR